MAITTAEVRDRISSAPYIGKGAPGRAAYDEAVAAIEAEWKTWLYEDAAGDLRTEAADLIFQKAYSDGHASGYEDIDFHFRELVELVRSVVELNID